MTAGPSVGPAAGASAGPSVGPSAGRSAGPGGAVGRRGRRPFLAAVVAVALVLLAGAAVVLRVLVVDQSWFVVATAAAPYLMLGAPAALVIAAFDRRWLLAVIAAVVTVMAATTQLPLLGAQRPPPDAFRLTMMTANLKLGSADPAALVRLVEEHRVDVITTQELTQLEADRLRSAGLDSVLPYAAIDARDGAAGVGIWSRYPLRAVDRVSGYRLAFVTARIDVPTIAYPPTVVATHMPGPWPQSATTWARDLAKLPGTLRELSRAAGSGAILVGGDLNATYDMRQFRVLLRGGFHDAAAQSGAGLRATYPGDTRVPPLIAIDHVLTYQAVATNARPVRLPGSDHRALLVHIALPRAGG